MSLAETYPPGNYYGFAGGVGASGLTGSPGFSGAGPGGVPGAGAGGAPGAGAGDVSGGGGAGLTSSFGGGGASLLGPHATMVKLAKNEMATNNTMTLFIMFPSFLLLFPHPGNLFFLRQEF